MADKGKLYVRAGVVDITPTGRVPLGCNDHTYSSGVAADSRLEANILLIGEGSEQVAIVTLDALYVGDLLRSRIISEMNGFFEPERLITTASHAHTATMFDESKPGLGFSDSNEIDRVASIVSDEILRLSKLLPSECIVEFGQSTHDLSVSRRKKRFFVLEKHGRRFLLKFRDVVMGPNYSDRIDKGIRRIIFKGINGEHLAQIWSAAIHPTSFPDPGIISSDYIGAVRDEIRRDQKKPSMPVLFFQGFSGEIRAKTPETTGFARLLTGPRFKKFSRDEYVHWCRSLAAQVSSTETFLLRNQDFGFHKVQVSSESFIVGAPGPTFGQACLISFGYIGFVTLPTEAVSHYQWVLEKQFNGVFQSIFGVGCADHVWGYSPSLKMIWEGGYESHGFLQSFGSRAVNPEVERNITEIFRQLSDLARKLKNPAS